MKKFRNEILLILSFIYIMFSLSSCATDNKNSTTEVSNLKFQSPKNIKLKWYLRGYDSNSLIKSHNEVEGLKEIQKRTGIQVDFLEASGNVNEQYTMMIASGDYPDILHWKVNSYPGGVSQLLKSGVIINLNELIDNNAPNFKKILEDNPDIRKELTLYDNTIPYFPSINPLKSKEDKCRQATSGLIIRSDWLNNVSMKVPTTIDEWYKVLKAFKEKDPNGNSIQDEIPFDGGGLTLFETAWGIRNTFYINPKTNKISYGPMEPIFKDYITTMRNWYSEGLLGRNNIVNDTKVYTSNIINDICGSFKGLDNAWTKFLPTLQSKNHNAQLTAVPWPIGVAGKSYTDRPELATHISSETISITSSCKYPEEATKLIDFMYGEEGATLINWGIENKSYVIENGKKSFIDSVLKDGTLNKYASPRTSWPKYGSNDAAIQLSSKEMIESGETWQNADTGLLLPPSLPFSEEDDARISEIMTEVNTYSSDMYNKFIVGVEPISNFDLYVDTLKKMHIDEALNIYQAAYDKYNSKK